MGMKGAKLSDIKQIYSHVHAIPQCRKLIKELGAKPIVRADTAGAAQELAELGDSSIGAIASSLAAEIYGLEILRKNVQDEDHNATRFVVLSRDPLHFSADEKGLKTSLFFQVRNIPAALYKAMGGFATNNVQMTKLESYIGPGFQTAFFYLEIEGHPDNRPVKLALEELSFFAKDVRVVGTYKAETPVS
jgi:prephenate dehydratase